jgi:hypothetical protein
VLTVFCYSLYGGTRSLSSGAYSGDPLALPILRPVRLRYTSIGQAAGDPVTNV